MTAQSLAFSMRLRRDAACGGLLTLAGLASAPLIGAGGSLQNAVLWLLLMATALPVVILSLHLLLDAMLFRLIASFLEEAAGLNAVDDFLARTGLRAVEAGVRPLADRIAGTRRVVRRQRIAMAIFVALFAAFAFLANAIPAAGGA